jgi:hypothetical protein
VSPRRGVKAWPARDDVDAWAILANKAMQLETLEADLAENEAWSQTMRALIKENLDYETFTERRLAALKDRLRRRKLSQTNLRYRYGFKDRSTRLVRSDVQKYLAH